MFTFGYLTMLYEREPISSARECPKGPIRVVVSERISIGLPGTGNNISGVVKFDRRIDDVIGMRVLYFALSQESPLNQYDGSLIKLSSSILGSGLQRAPFQLANTTETGTSTALPHSGVIALSTVCQANRTWPFEMTQVNQRLNFTSPKSIEYFDWLIQSVNGISNLIHLNPFALEFVIEFYTLCKC